MVFGENFRVKLGLFLVGCRGGTWRLTLSTLLWWWRNGTSTYDCIHRITLVYSVPCRFLRDMYIYIDNAPVLSCGVPTVVYIIMMMLYTRSLNVKKNHKVNLKTRCGNQRHFYLHTYIFCLCRGSNGRNTMSVVEPWVIFSRFIFQTLGVSFVFHFNRGILCWAKHIHTDKSN